MSSIDTLTPSGSLATRPPTSPQAQPSQARAVSAEDKFRTTADVNSTSTSTPGSAGTPTMSSGTLSPPPSPTTLPVPPQRTFSFAAAGWMQCYHFGVAKAITDAGQHNESNLYCGSSAGALASAAIVGGTDIDALQEYACQCVNNCHKRWYHAFCLREYVRRGIQMFAVEQYAKDRAGLQAKLNSQLEVYATTLPTIRSKCFTEFNEEEDLEEALIASCLLTPLAGLPFRLRATGQWVIDGGLTAFQPRSGDPNTVCVSALYFGSADIRPSKFVPAWWGLYPPSEKEYRDLFALGYNDALEFFVREKTLSPATFTQLRQKYPRVCRLQGKPGPAQMFIESLAFVFFIFVLRPLGLFLVYGEMVMVAVVSFCLALLHDVLPTMLSNIVGTRAGRRLHRTRRAAWADAYNAVRNLVSLRVPLHMVLGSKVPVNASRLEKYSRMYRLFRPVWAE